MKIVIGVFAHRVYLAKAKFFISVGTVRMS